MDCANKNLAIYLAHRVELIDYATAILGDRSLGEDVVQEAFLRLKSSAADRVFEEPVGYLRRIIRNLAIDSTRRTVAERRRYDNDADYEAVAEDRPSQEDVLAHREALQRVMAAMEELPERTRVAIEMYRFEGCKLKEVAAHLGISIALAHALVYKGLEHCRKSLSENGPG